MSGNYTTLLSGFIFSHCPSDDLFYFVNPSTLTCFIANILSIPLFFTLSTSSTVCRSAAEELVRSQFGAFKNLPPQGNSSEQRRQAMGGSAVALNKLNDSAPLSSRNSSSIPDLVNTGATAATAKDANSKQQLPDDLKAINSSTEPATIRSKFTPGNIFKNFFK